MTGFAEKAAGGIDRLNTAIGIVTAWMATFMVAIQFGTVLFRYLYGVNLIFVQDTVQYLHALMFMLGAGYLLVLNGHVRVDLLFRSLSRRRKASIDLIGSVALLVPFCLTVLIFSIPYAADSWSILEGSREITGLHLTFLLKSVIVVFGLLLMLQALATIVRCSLTLLRDG